MPEVPQFDKCCFCIDLRTGALILGFLGLTGNVFFVLLVIIAAIILGITMATMTDVGVGIGVLTCTTLCLSSLFFLVSVAFYSVLLVGIYQENPTYVQVGWIYMIVYALITATWGTSYLNISCACNIVGILIDLCLSIYLALCVRSYELTLL